MALSLYRSAEHVKGSMFPGDWLLELVIFGERFHRLEELPFLLNPTYLTCIRLVLAQVVILDGLGSFHCQLDGVANAGESSKPTHAWSLTLCRCLMQQLRSSGRLCEPPPGRPGNLGGRGGVYAETPNEEFTCGRPRPGPRRICIRQAAVEGSGARQP